MIFVTVGTQLPFDRLIDALDRWAERNPQVRVIAQIGRGAKRPRFIEWREELSPVEFDVMMAAADLVVAHAGMGTILRAQAEDKPLVVVPRRAELGEHRNDHQLATVKYLTQADLITAAEDELRLMELLDERAAVTPPRCASKERLDSLVKGLAEFLNA